MGVEWEMLFVDDGSSDGSDELPRSFHGKEGRIRVIFLSRNFGQHAALSAGLEHARGEVVVIMDGDLQFDPEDIPRLVDTVFDGYDLVGGWRRDRKDATLRRKLPSKVINAVIGWTTGVKLRDYNCGFKAVRSEVVRRVNLQGNQRRYLAPLLVNLSDRVKEIPVSHHPRTLGESKYTLSRSLAMILDFIVTFRISFQDRGQREGIPFNLVRFLWDRKRDRKSSRDQQDPLFVIKEKLPQEGKSWEKRP